MEKIGENSEKKLKGIEYKLENIKIWRKIGENLENEGKFGET